MTTFYQIPITGTPQSFGITLSGNDYVFEFYYANTIEGGWILNISDSLGNPMVNGIPLVTGVNLLAQYPYLNFGGGLWVQTPSNPSNTPTFTNLGTDSLLFWLTP